MKRLCLSSILCVLPLAVCAQHDHIQLPAHVHGITELEIAADGDELAVSINSPAYNLIGFEHAPGNERQKRRMHDALKLLRTPELFLDLPGLARCKPFSVEVESPLEAESETAIGSEEHEHEHEHEHEQHDGAQEGERNNHAEIHARYHFQCTAPQKLSGLAIDLFTHFPLIEEIHAQIITAERQYEMRLTPGKTDISLTR